MKPEYLLIIFLPLFFFHPFMAECQENKIEKSVRLILSEQEKSWNNGNIETFMQGYWKSDSLIFIGKNGINYGWQLTLDNYRKNYPDKATMGILKFDIYKIDILSDSTAFVIGKWVLTRDKGNISGYFTLLIKTIDGKCVIVCDHTS